MPAFLERAVTKIKRQSNVDNPWAVAISSFKKAGGKRWQLIKAWMKNRKRK
ncbi:MAG: hypothetical protein ACOYWZ_11095 [Bacillota bacterium]